MPVSGEFGGRRQTGRAGANHRDAFAGCRSLQGTLRGPALFNGFAADPPLEMADRHREGVVLVDATLFAERLGRTHVAAGRGQNIGFTQYLVGLTELLLGDEPDELGNIDVGGTSAHAGRIIALAAGLGHLQDGVERFRAPFLVDRLVNFGIPGHAASAAAVAHDLGASAAGHTDLLGIEGPLRGQFPDTIWIGKGHPAQTDQTDPALLHVGGGHLGQKLAQPRIAAPDHRQIRESLLHLAHNMDKPGHPHQRRFRRQRRASGGQIKRPVHVRVEIGIANREVDQRRALLLEEPYQLLGLAQICLAGIEFVHAKPVGSRHRVEDVQARGHDEARHRLADLLDDVAEEAGAVLERTTVAAVLPGIGRVQFRNQVTMADLDVHAVKPGLLGALGRLDVIIFQPFECVVAD